jgi:superfamily II DNA or RNA helicase/HKD family nuclease
LSRAAVLRTVMGYLQEPNPQALPSLTRVLASCSEADEVREEGFPHSGEAVPQLLSEGSLIKVFEREIQESQQVFLASAFCSGGVFNLLHKPLERLKERKGRVYLLTSFMGHHNNPRVLMRLQQSLPAGEVRIYDPEGTLSGGSFIPPDFHIKAYLFEKSTGRNSLIIGSSNLTLAGMMKNVEWNYFSNSEVSFRFAGSSAFDAAKRRFLEFWEGQSFPLTEAFTAAYLPVWRAAHTRMERDPSVPDSKPPKPREAQEAALQRLAHLRDSGFRKAAVIAATGLGKTFLAAFDARNTGARRVLFIAHRENILIQACKTFARVFGSGFAGRVVSGNDRLERDTGEGSFFATVQYLSRGSNLAVLSLESFDYVVIDEFHHAAAESYRKVLTQLKPGFLLGMTATPERMDGRDVLEICDYTVAYEARLFNAIERGWLVPFQYFAVYDPTDYSAIRWTGRGYDEQQLERSLSNDTRVELVHAHLFRRLPSCGSFKVLAFCANVGHARYMADQFNRRGTASAAVTGETAVVQRERLMDDLADDDHPLQVIFSVDVFNEGIDIPQVSHILLLRPTESYSLLVQQIGRGLRRSGDKEYVVVLDFVGNYRGSSLIPAFLNGRNSVRELKRDASLQEFSLPVLCTAEVDAKVVRIWEDEISRLLRRGDPKKLYLSIYRQAEAEAGRSLQIMDLFIDEERTDFSTGDCLKRFGSWLRFKEEAGSLTEYEKSLLGTPGERLLEHVERELRPNRTYKMALLSSLPASSEAAWNVDETAAAFLRFYLTNPLLIEDYPDLNRFPDPAAYPLSRVKSHLLKNPLHFLSNTEEDCFTLDRSRETFSLKEEYRPYWNDASCQALIRDRLTYVLKRYQRDRLGGM